MGARVGGKGLVVWACSLVFLSAAPANAEQYELTESEVMDVAKFNTADVALFGIKIGEEYGGLGLSQLMYARAIGLVTSVDGSLTALLSASQSIGVPVPDLYALIAAHSALRQLPRLLEGRADFVIKPDRGAGGRSDGRALAGCTHQLDLA